jgi:hypothetical protein
MRGSLKADTVRPHVSRQKDKEIALGRCRMGRYEGRSTGRLRASSEGVKGWILPPAGGAMNPPLKTRTPSGLLVSSSYRCAAHVHRTVHFYA